MFLTDVKFLVWKHGFSVQQMCRLHPGNVFQKVFKLFQKAFKHLQHSLSMFWTQFIVSLKDLRWQPSSQKVEHNKHTTHKFTLCRRRLANRTQPLTNHTQRPTRRENQPDNKNYAQKLILVILFFSLHLFRALPFRHGTVDLLRSEAFCPRVAGCLSLCSVRVFVSVACCLWVFLFAFCGAGAGFVTVCRFDL